MACCPPCPPRGARGGCPSWTTRWSPLWCCPCVGTSWCPSSASSCPLNAVLLSWERALSSYGVASAYGPFRRMTGVGGRPEVVLEWSDQLEGDWHEFEFRYKPGNVSRAPPFLVPHQPRLDWQMWFAALSTYQRAPWVVQLINRLLHNESTVRALLKNPPERPEFVRASLFLYHFKGEGRTGGGGRGRRSSCLPSHRTTRPWWSS